MSKTGSTTAAYANFWNWFEQHQQGLSNTLKEGGDLQSELFETLATKLTGVKGGENFGVSMDDEGTVELVFTTQGHIKNIVFAEELVNAAPKIKGWKFTALTPPSAVNIATLKWDGYEINGENLSFYANQSAKFPDEINITVVHDKFDVYRPEISYNFVNLILKNYLGELYLLTTVDHYYAAGKVNPNRELIPIDKLQAYVRWREKEFVEKYEDVRYIADGHDLCVIEGEIGDGIPIFGVVDKDLLEWEGRISHPWILSIIISYNSDNGMADERTDGFIETLETELTDALTDFDGYHYICKERTPGQTQIYFVCREFRKPAKIMYAMEQLLDELDFSYQIVHDKYWQTFEKYFTHLKTM